MGLRPSLFIPPPQVALMSQLDTRFDANYKALGPKVKLKIKGGEGGSRRGEGGRQRTRNETIARKRNSGCGVVGRRYSQVGYGEKFLGETPLWGTLEIGP